MKSYPYYLAIKPVSSAAEANRLKSWIDESIQSGVIIGDVPSFRVDNMPYGGVKDSGLGHVHSAIEDMREVKLMVVK